MRKNSKGFTQILIILLIAAIGIVGYLGYKNYWQKSQNTNISAWKTYTNTPMGFSLKLPSGWFTHPEEKTLYGYQISFSYPIDNSSGQSFAQNQLASISIGMTTNNTNSVDKIAQDRINMPYSYLDNSITHIKVDGEEAVILDDKQEKAEEVLVNHGTNSYLISVGSPGQLGILRNAFEQIVSTFKFLK